MLHNIGFRPLSERTADSLNCFRSLGRDGVLLNDNLDRDHDEYYAN